MTHQPAISLSISIQHLFNRAGGRTSNVLQKMKQAAKLFGTFLGGAIAATTVLSIWLPPRLLSNNIVVGETSPPWTLKAFETINEEIGKLVENPHVTMAVIPTAGGNGYSVVAFDERLRARFGLFSWDQALERIEDRMESLRKNQEDAEQAEAPNRR